MKQLPQGTRLNDRYVVIDYLGGGANGRVYRVFDENLATEAALKLMEPVAGQPVSWREAQALEQLRSEFLLPVFNADVIHGSDIRFITSPVMSGGNLAQRVAPHGVTPRQAARWGGQIAHGLDRVHAASLVHRDVKPDNCYLSSDDTAILGDLGMAASIDASGHAPPDGTPATAAPEVFGTGGYTSFVSDVYSLGATMFYLLAGEFPVDHRLPGREHEARVVAGRLRRLRDLAPHVTVGLAQVVERALARDPAMRQQTALAFANELANATHHARQWRRITCEPGHLVCLSGGPRGGAQPVRICTVPATGGRVDLVVVNASGQHQRRYEVRALKAGRVLVELRALVSKV